MRRQFLSLINPNLALSANYHAEAQRRKGAEEEEKEGVVVQYSVMLLRED